MPLSVPEIRRLLVRTLPLPPRTVARALRCSRWRRRQQARAWACHERRRQARLLASLNCGCSTKYRSPQVVPPFVRYWLLVLVLGAANASTNGGSPCLVSAVHGWSS